MIPNEDFSQRTYGQLPEGSQVRRVEHDMHTDAAHGEKTWTTAQSFRDILQNHLDANTQVFYDQLVLELFGKPLKVLVEEKGERATRYISDFMFAIFIYHTSRLNFTDSAQKITQEHIQQLAKNVPGLKSEFITHTPVGILQWDAIDSMCRDISYEPPQLLYEVQDTTGEEGRAWVPLEDLRSDKYREKTDSETGEGIYRFQIMGLKIVDEGKGFDSKLTAFYKSTKGGQKIMRGKYGEGSKMSVTHLERHNAYLKSRSELSYTDKTGRERLRQWQLRPFLGKMVGTEVELPSQEGRQNGSFTLIRIDTSNPKFQADFRANIDPREKTGLESNCSEYKPSRFRYAAPLTDVYNQNVVGIDPFSKAGEVFVQGLKIPVDSHESESGKAYFSYNILDSSIIAGRDRSHVNWLARDAIVDFWKRVDEPFILGQGIWALIDGGYRTVEEEPIQQLLTARYTSEEIRKIEVQNTLYQELIRILHLDSSSPVVLLGALDPSDYELGKTSLHRSLIEQGYRLQRINRIDSDVNKRVVEHLNELGFQVYTLEEVKQQALAKEEDTKSDEVSEKVSAVFSRALIDVRGQLEKLGIGSDALPIHPRVTVVPRLNKEDAAVVITKEGTSFKVKVRIEADEVSLPVQEAHWERKLKFYILACLNQTEDFTNELDVHHRAQENAQMLLDRSFKLLVERGHITLPQFQHSLSEGEQVEASDAYFSSHIQELRQKIEYWQNLNNSRSSHLTAAVFKECVAWAKTLRAEQQLKIIRVLEHRYIIENGTLTFLNESKEIQEVELSALPVGCEWEGNPVYTLPGGKALFPCDIKDGGVVTVSEEERFVLWGDRWLSFSKHCLERENSLYSSSIGGIISVETNGIVLPASWNRGGDFDLRYVQQLLASLQISAAEKEKDSIIEVPNGVLETSLSREYGEKEWNRPTRFFQDLLQNHLDASEDVTLLFKVKTSWGESQNQWLPAEAVGEFDEIIGFKVIDQGAGYTPNKLGELGDSSKLSPIFAGKYGEGQKMIAAAATRHGFRLAYSSRGMYEGQKKRWVAEVGTQDEELIQDGQVTIAQRVIFNSRLTETDGEPYTSSTEVELPEDATFKQKSEWRKWIDVVDPRQVNEKGDRGIGRYVMRLRDRRNDVIDLGFMRILLDEPGSIYENGLLIKQTEELMFGWDVPDIVATRERDQIKGKLLEEYIAYALQECDDVRLHAMMLSVIKQKYLSSLLEGKYTAFAEKELNFPGIYSTSSAANRVIWDLANVQELGGIIVASREDLESTVEHYTTLVDKDQYDSEGRNKKVLEEARMVLANLDHLPQQRLVNLGKREFSKWQQFFPTAVDVLKNLNVTDLPVAPETHQQLLEVTRKAAEAIFEALQATVSGGNTTFAPEILGLFGNYRLDHLDLMFVNDNESYWTRKLIEHIVPWSDPEELKQHPERVFAAPQQAAYLGIAERDRIGYNETLLTPTQQEGKILGTAVHELVHKIFFLPDYVPEFGMVLNLVTENLVKLLDTDPATPTEAATSS